MLYIPQLGTIITCYPHTPINDVASFLLDELNTCENVALNGNYGWRRRATDASKI